VLGIESWLNGIWYGRDKPPLLLRIVARLFAFTLKRRPLVSLKHLTAPIIIVGNFTVGGTGKTPLIIALITQLKAFGYRPGVISRGYGRRHRSAFSVTAASSIMHSGDEPLLIAKRTGVPVRVDGKRRHAAEYLLAQGCDVIVSDDGMQHRDLPRHIEIEVFDYQRQYGNGYLLPAGPLREPVRTVDMRVGNGQVGDDSAAYAMQLQMRQCYHLNTGESKSLGDFKGRTIQAVAGIGYPQRFFNALAALDIHVVEHPFPDHHRFSANELPKQGPVLMTEKDAVRCIGIVRADIWVVPVDAVLSNAFVDDLKRRIISARKTV
jgi:tetraacyldisaccharide 4'-kinase